MLDKKQHAVVTLIGMPGSGKSTVGRLLAQRLHWAFIDTDALVVESVGLSLQSYLERFGYLALREQEENAILTTSFQKNSIIATGGSVVYSRSAMALLKKHGAIVFLSADKITMELRVDDFSRRGLACAPGTSLAQLFGERLPLYKKHADIIVDVVNASPEEVVDSIVNGLHVA